MNQVLRGPGAKPAIEIVRTEGEVVLCMLDDDCSVALKSHPVIWKEVGEEYKEGFAFLNFDDHWKPMTRVGPHGVEPYPVIEAVRKIIRGVYSAPMGFRGGALAALVDVLPAGEVHLFARGSGFIGRFAAVEDAQMIAKAMEVASPIIFDSAEAFRNLPTLDQSAVMLALDADRQWPDKITSKTSTEVFELAKGVTVVKPKKVEKAEAKQRRADGPVAQVRALFETMKDKSTAEILDAAEKAGINRGTASTQLGRWRKEKGIVVKRGGARKPKEKAAAAPAKKTSEKKDKKSSGNKKAATPAKANSKKSSSSASTKTGAKKTPSKAKGSASSVEGGAKSASRSRGAASSSDATPTPEQSEPASSAPTQTASAPAESETASQASA